MTSCRTFTWTGRELVDDQASARGIKSVEQLRAEYDANRYWSFWRSNWDGRFMAMQRDWANLHRSLDRHAWNYRWEDPYLFE